MLSGHDLTELSAEIRGIEDFVAKLSNKLDDFKKNNLGSSTENRNFENPQFLKVNYSQSIPTRVSSESMPYVEIVSTTLRSNILQGKDIYLA